MSRHEAPEKPPSPPPRRMRKKDEAPLPDEAGSTKATHRDPARAAARTAGKTTASGKTAGGAESPERHLDEQEKPRDRMKKETLRGRKEDVPSGTSSNAEKNERDPEEKKGAFSKLKNIFTGNSETGDGKAAEISSESRRDRDKEKRKKEKREKEHDRSPRPGSGDSRRKAPGASRKERDNSRTARGEEGKRRGNDPAAESKREARPKETAQAAAGRTKEHRNEAANGTDRGNESWRDENRRRLREKRERARQRGPDEHYQTAQEDLHEQGEGRMRYDPERYFEPSELDSGIKCKTCGQPKPRCGHCYQLLKAHHILSRVRHENVTESRTDLDEGSDCEGCGQPVPLCHDCKLPLPEEKVLERIRGRIRTAKAK